MTVTPSPRDSIDVVVESKRELADGVAGLRLRRPDGAPLPAWEPGAHIDVELPGDLVRQFSLCGDPRDATAYDIAVRREVDGRGGSAAVHNVVQPGDALRISAPRNHFAFDDADRYLFVAGGIGITPILPMIAAAEARGAEWNLAYCGRSRRSMAFLAELQRYGDRVALHPSDEGRRLDVAAFLGEPALGAAVYCCGPAGLLDAALDASNAWPPGALRIERFEPIEATGPETSFEVELDSTGEVLEVPEGRTILEVVREAGVDIDSSCEEGTCGTCETVVLEGEPDHRDAVLSELERELGETMMICVSRCRGRRLVLDL
ncbi:PDR/VanB family oxidoreductase [Microbacterium album]|uniref:Ferredoxin n=1 Tax=Microbacterium album TaxID=2053191 RepID=A0A917IEE4_9MICO|nr:PDR/VanB family oxidoreductase [Microbacterium album]GGH44769.1 ferredoxin [Microbacterium album]